MTKYVVLICLLFMVLSPAALAQPEGAAADAAVGLPGDFERVHIDWGEKVRQGGLTMVALCVLSIAMGVFILERSINLRSRHVAPPKLSQDMVSMVTAKDFEGITKACRKEPSTLARVVDFVVEHRDNALETVSTAAGDIAAREVRAMYGRTYPLAVIASLAPLLGLLGTVIGMIEAFELVSIYGDDGGATLLAGSIAKALITTAVGLIIAIPALVAYHFFKHRIDTLTSAVEVDVEKLLKLLYMQGSEPSASVHAAGPSANADGAVETLAHS